MTELDCESLMQARFPARTGTRRMPFLEKDIRTIAQILVRDSRVAWSRIPRIYSVLRVINHVELVDRFLDEDMTDAWFPFSQKSLPSSFHDQPTRLSFLNNQHLVFNAEAFGLERAHTKHSHFRDPLEVPLRTTAVLGKGSFGYVDRVLSTITYKEYARKLIPRRRTFKKDKEVLRSFERELISLKKRATHRHVVEIVGSYTDPKYVGIITSPVAECNLHEYLTRDLEEGARSFLRTFFGCLATALGFLHDNRIWHKDIKPQNVLVHEGRVLLTDFGLDLDVNQISNSTTVGPTWATPRYSAPDVANHSERDWPADIWSLGCVFLEIWTVLNHSTVPALHKHMSNTGTMKSSYSTNFKSVGLWIKHIKGIPGRDIDRVPATWIANMVRLEPEHRWSACAIQKSIYEHSLDPAAPFAFAGLCCLEDGDADESVASSIEDLTETSETTPLSATSPLNKNSYRSKDDLNAQSHSTSKSASFEQSTAQLQTTSSRTSTVDEASAPHTEQAEADRAGAKCKKTSSSISKSETRWATAHDRRVTPSDTSTNTQRFPPQPFVEDLEDSLARETGYDSLTSEEATLVQSQPPPNLYVTSKRWVFFSTGTNCEPEDSDNEDKSFSTSRDPKTSSKKEPDPKVTHPGNIYRTPTSPAPIQRAYQAYVEDCDSDEDLLKSKSFNTPSSASKATPEADQPHTTWFSDAESSARVSEEQPPHAAKRPFPSYPGTLDSEFDIWSDHATVGTHGFDEEDYNAQPYHSAGEPYPYLRPGPAPLNHAPNNFHPSSAYQQENTSTGGYPTWYPNYAPHGYQHFPNQHRNPFSTSDYYTPPYNPFDPYYRG